MTEIEKIPELVAELEQYAFKTARWAAEDPRCTLETRKSESKRVLNDAVAKLDALQADMLENLEQTRAKLRKASRPDLTPPADDVPRLMYLRDTLEELWATQDNQAFLAGWQDALDDGDPLILRVYRDFGIGELRSREPYADLELADIQDLTPAGDLIERTRQAMLTPKQRAAAEQLAQLDQAALQATRAVSGAKVRLSRAHFNPRTGEIVDGQTLSTRDLLRGV